MSEPVIIPPAGVHAAGFFTATVFADPAHPPAILADDIDATTGEYRSILGGLHPVDSHLLTMVRAHRGSGAALRDWGHRLDRITKADEQASRRAMQELRLALKHLVDRGDVRLDKVLAEPMEGVGDGVALFLLYTNLRTGVQAPKVRL